MRKTKARRNLCLGAKVRVLVENRVNPCYWGDWWVRRGQGQQVAPSATDLKLEMFVPTFSNSGLWITYTKTYHKCTLFRHTPANRTINSYWSPAAHALISSQMVTLGITTVRANGKARLSNKQISGYKLLSQAYWAVCCCREQSHHGA